MDNRTGVGRFISGVFLGGLAGAAVAILYAPQSGDETRRQIRESANQAADSARQAAANVQGQAQTFLGETQSRVNQMIGDLNTGMRRKSNEATDASRKMVSGDGSGLAHSKTKENPTTI